MTISLVIWDEGTGFFIKKPVEAAGVRFNLGTGKDVEISKGASGSLVIRSIHGRLIITMDVANQFR